MINIDNIFYEKHKIFIFIGFKKSAAHCGKLIVLYDCIGPFNVIVLRTIKGKVQHWKSTRFIKLANSYLFGTRADHPERLFSS